MAYYLVKYDNANARNRPVDENNDIFGFEGIRLGGVLFDETNIGTKTEINNVQSNLTALQNSYNAHVYLQALDLAAIRADIDSLYAICRALGLDITAIMDDIPQEYDIIATSYGQTVFTSPNIPLFNWSEFNSVVDLVVHRNGQELVLDKNGGSNEDYFKINSYQINLTMDNPVYVGEKITIRVERKLLNIRFNGYFYSHTDGLTGRGVVSANRYTPNSDKLMVWRNGVLLVKSATLGDPIDRYEETTSQMITLGQNLDTVDVISLLNRISSPAFRFYQTGITTTTITVPTYTVGNKTLKVFRNGLIMNEVSNLGGDAVDRYAETSSTQITLSQIATANEIFTFECSASVPTWMQVQTGFVGGDIFSPMSVLPDVISDYDKLLIFRNGKLMYNSVSLGSSVDRYSISGPSSIILEVAAIVSDWFVIVYDGM